jgi:tetratricopeptide (TPR) repeat protein
MDSAQRAHIEHLLQLNRAHLRELEAQQATLGIMAPSGIAVQIDEYQHAIGDLERQLAEALPRHNLPPRDYERFVGRQKELEEVRRLLLPYPKSRHHLVTIDGIGGIGKSALALETAYHARESYASLPEAERFEAIVWVSAKRTYLTADGILEQRQAFRTLDDLYAAIAQVLDYPAITRAPAEEQRAIVERVLAEQRTLLILDNLETVDDEELLIFLRLLPDPTKAIVTTRHRIDVAYPVRLLGMPQADALALIGQEAARKAVGILTATENTEQASSISSVNSVAMKEDLYRKTGGVPLAIVWSIGLMGLGGSVESVLRRLGSGQSDIARFCFDESVAQIRGRDAHKLLLALSLFASDASREALGIVAGLGEDEFGRDIGLEELLRLSLVNKDGDRFSLLPLTRSFAQAEAERQGEWIEKAKEQQLKYFVPALDSNDNWYYNWRRQELIEAETPNILAIIQQQRALIQYHDIDNEHREITPSSLSLVAGLQHLYRVLTRVYRIRGFWSECERLCEESIDIGRQVHDYISVGWRLYDLSRLAYNRGDLKLAKKLANESRDAWVLTNMGVHHADRSLGLIAIRENNLVEARKRIIAGFEAYRVSGRTAAFCQFASAYAELTRAEGVMETAVEYYRQAIELNRNRGDKNNQSYDTLGLAEVLLVLGQADAAQECFNESLKLARESGRVDVIARALLGGANLEFSQNQRASAESNARQALDLFRRLGMRREQAEAEALLARLGD